MKNSSKHTRQAIKEARAISSPRFNTSDELFASLDKSAEKSRPTLQELLSKCDLSTTSHPEFDWGLPVGREII